MLIRKFYGFLPFLVPAAVTLAIGASLKSAGLFSGFAI